MRQRFQACLAGNVGSQKGRRQLCSDRADIHNSSGRPTEPQVGAQERQEGLGDDHGAGQVDVDLLPELGDGLGSQWAWNRDARIVDQPAQPLPVQGRTHLEGGSSHCILIGDVEEQWSEQVAKFGLQSLGVGLLPDAAKDPHPPRHQYLRCAPADATRYARDQHRLHACPSRCASYIFMVYSVHFKNPACKPVVLNGSRR